MKRKEWFSRKFGVQTDNETLPGIIERLEGTPARMEEKMRRINPLFYNIGWEGKWSIQENAGHLLDLEPLWSSRVDDLIQGKKILTEADLSNKKTDQAQHNEASMESILRSFRAIRTGLVEKIHGMAEEELYVTSLHPRLKTPMRLIDLAYFVSEHDDHHLSRITELDSILSRHKL